MEIAIIKPVDVRLDGVVRSLKTWTRLNLPDMKAEKLICAGYAKATVFDAEYWQSKIRSLVDAFGRDDRPGCWEWVKSTRPDLWSSHSAAMRQLGSAFRLQDAQGLLAARQQAVDTFAAMLEAWENRDEQPALMAA